MFRFCLMLAVLVSACAPHAGVDLSPEEDARRIYQLSGAEEVTRLTMMEMDTLMVASAQKAARDQGIALSDEAAEYFVDLLLNETITMMLDDIKSETIRLYVETYSPEALQAYRIFLESPQGSEIAEKQSELTQRLFEVGEVAGQNAGFIAGQRIETNISNDIWTVDGSDAAKAELKDWLEATRGTPGP